MNRIIIFISLLAYCPLARAEGEHELRNIGRWLYHSNSYQDEILSFAEAAPAQRKLLSAEADTQTWNYGGTRFIFRPVEGKPDQMRLHLYEWGDGAAKSPGEEIPDHLDSRIEVSVNGSQVTLQKDGSGYFIQLGSAASADIVRFDVRDNQALKGQSNVGIALQLRPSVDKTKLRGILKGYAESYIESALGPDRDQEILRLLGMSGEGGWPTVDFSKEQNRLYKLAPKINAAILALPRNRKPTLNELLALGKAFGVPPEQMGKGEMSDARLLKKLQHHVEVIRDHQALSQAVESHPLTAIKQGSIARWKSTDPIRAWARRCYPGA